MPLPDRRATRSRLVALLALVVGAGCAEAMEKHEMELAGQVSAPVMAPAALAPTGAGMAPSGGENQDVLAAQADPAKAATAGRKIIYTAQVDLVTEDLPKLETALLQLVQTSGGYVADSNRIGSAGSSRSGSWKVRVPVDRYDSLLRGVSGLGELVSTRSESEDVSAEYFDLDARQNAKKTEEARLLKHLSDSTGRLEEILAVERELSRVRIEIERMQGRLAVLSNQTTLATITVRASEVRGYLPPNPPTLGQRVARTFGESVRSLRVFGEGLLLIAVAFAPWAPLVLILGSLAILVLRRLVAWISREPALLFGRLNRSIRPIQPADAERS